MASTVYRKVSPSVCIAGSSENQTSTRPTLLPRTSSTLTNIANRLEANSSLPSLHTGRIRFADSVPIPIRAPNLQLKVVTPLEEPKSPLEAVPLPLNTRLRHLSVPNINTAPAAESSPKAVSVPESRASAALDTNPASPVNTFADSAAPAIESPELRISCEETNPFSDADVDTTTDESTISSTPSTLAGDHNGLAAAVRILGSEVGSIRSATEDDINGKELIAYTISMQQVYHPDIARAQYRDRQGHLYVMATNLMSDRHLCPLDLTEYVFSSRVIVNY